MVSTVHTYAAGGDALLHALDQGPPAMAGVDGCGGVVTAEKLQKRH